MGGATKTIVQVVAVVAAVYAGPQIGAAIMETMGTTAAAAGISEAAVGAAAISGSTAAVNTAIKGGDIGDVLEAGAKGAISGAVGQAAGAAAGGGVPGGIAGGTAGGATQAALSGQDVGKGALMGGATGGVTSGVTQALTPDIPLPSGSTTDAGQGFDYAGGMTPEQVAAANPDLYPGGKLPSAGTETVFAPGGESYAQASTPIQARPSEFAKAAGKITGEYAGQQLGAALYDQPSQSTSTLTSTGLFTPTSIVPTTLTGIAPTARGKPILGSEDEEATGAWGAKTLRG